MGANQSQDSERNLENSSVKPQNQEGKVQPMGKPAEWELLVSESRAMEKTEKIQLPHNYEAILKDADSSVDMSSMDKLLSQLYDGVFLSQKRRKYWVDKKSGKNCFMLFPRDLSITWAEDSRYWYWSYHKETTSETFIEVAELLQVCWLELHGKLDVAKLSPITLYEVVLIVMFRDQAFGWQVPVNFRLTLPTRQNVERKEKLMTKPRREWIEIPMGEFTTSSESVGELDIYIHEHDTGLWKAGLLVKGVAIRPKD